MKKFKVKVTNSGVFILPNGRKVRTPVELVVNENKLQQYQVQFRARGLTYKILDVIEDEEFSQELPPVSKKVIIEELNTQPKKTAEPKSFLDKLIADNEDEN